MIEREQMMSKAAAAAKIKVEIENTVVLYIENILPPM